MSSQPAVPVKAPAMTFDVEAPTAEELRHAYTVAVRSRAAEEHIVRLVTRGEVKFAIWGPGEEVHGTATALALSKVVGKDNFGVVPHYRSGSLCSMWCELQGMNDFSERMLRQQFSRDTDTMSHGRQMVYHLNMPEVGILPVNSPVGMQLGKACGYGLGMKRAGQKGVTLGIIGDGTSAESDLHEAMNAASVWQTPSIYMVTDNGVAISTLPEEGRGIKDFKTYAESFGLRFFTCDGSDFWDVYQTTLRCATYVRDECAPAFIHVVNLPRFNGHSSAADVTFDLGQNDPLIRFGAELVKREVFGIEDVMTRHEEGSGRDFFAHHQLGSVMDTENERLRVMLDEIREEPHPDPSTIEDHIYAPFPTDAESPALDTQTNITYAGAIRSALDKLIERRNGFVMGQDVGRLGGVMTATAGLKNRHPDAIVDSPLNEPLIVGTSTGLGMYPGAMALPEIQFGDYSLNAFHWLVYLGQLHWSNCGQSHSKLLLRMPTDPFGGGAIYHSMSCDGYFCSIPGLVVVMPSTSFDVHGLLLTAGDYDGPVVCLEPKWMYRQSLGPAFPGEPTDKAGITKMKKATMRGEIPALPDVRVPFGKAAIRREGSDCTVVAWGRAVWTALDAAKILEGQGVSVEVIDLRTLVPPDMDAVMASVEKTGRLIVAAEDRPFGGFARQIQGDVVQRRPGTPSMALGQKNVPGVGQSLILEDATILNKQQFVDAAHQLLQTRVGGPSGVAFVPPRYFIG